MLELREDKILLDPAKAEVFYALDPSVTLTFDLDFSS